MARPGCSRRPRCARSSTVEGRASSGWRRPPEVAIIVAGHDSSPPLNAPVASRKSQVAPIDSSAAPHGRVGIAREHAVVMTHARNRFRLTEVALASHARPGGHIALGGRYLEGLRLRRAHGRKPSPSENLHLIGLDEFIKFNGIDGIRILASASDPLPTRRSRASWVVSGPRPGGCESPGGRPSVQAVDAPRRRP